METKVARHPWTPDSDDGHADLSSHDTWVAGTPYSTFHRMRDEDPVAWVDEADGSGFWAVTRYDDVVDLNRRWGDFTSYQGIRLEEMDAEETEARRTLMELDPPDHTRLRRLVNRGFTRMTVESYEESIRELTAGILDEALVHGEFDFVAEVARLLPMRMLGRLLGVPDDHAEQLVEWGDQLLSNSDPEYTDHVVDQVDTDEFRLIPFRSPAGLEVFRYAQKAAAERRGCPHDDVISRLLATTTDGEPLSDLEFNNFFALLVAAGNDTTRYSLTEGLRALVDHPKQMQALRNEQTLMGTAVEEILRWTTVTTHFRRTATSDQLLHGRTIRKGDKVVLWWASADYDERKFDDPYRFDIRRDPNDHVAFGRNGPHLCLGAWLARMEIRITLQELLARTTDIEIVHASDRLRSNLISGTKHLTIQTA
jgi:cytochrome P450